MTAEDLERDIRRNPTMNERFLLGLLDEARGRNGRVATFLQSIEEERAKRIAEGHDGLWLGAKTVIEELSNDLAPSRGEA